MKNFGIYELISRLKKEKIPSSDTANSPLFNKPFDLNEVIKLASSLLGGKNFLDIFSKNPNEKDAPSTPILKNEQFKNAPENTPKNYSYFSSPHTNPLVVAGVKHDEFVKRVKEKLD